MASAANYTATKTSTDGVEVVRLHDEARRAEVAVAIGVGNVAYELKINGKNALYFPFSSLADFKAKPALCGVPFLAPWANRLDHLGFGVNGKNYALNPGLGNVRLDPHGLPIHGLLSFSSLWQVIEATGGEHDAHVTSRLEFWKHPELMAQFPFAHTIEMTYRLQDGSLTVETALRNLGAEPMPVSIGFHPYFQLDDSPRDEWRAHLSAREHVMLSPLLVPTGERKSVDFPEPLPLRGAQLDDVFTGLVRNGDGRAEFSVSGKNERIVVAFGPKYPVAVAYAPAGRPFICFEPMAALTNALNRPEPLQMIAPGAEWRESFFITPSGF